MNKSHDPKDPKLQGEGNYTAARRHRASVKDFLESNDAERAASDAAPKTPAEARELKRAEEVGKSRARK